MTETLYRVQSERLVSAAYQMHRVHVHPMIHAVCLVQPVAKECGKVIAYCLMINGRERIRGIVLSKSMPEL